MKYNQFVLLSNFLNREKKIRIDVKKFMLFVNLQLELKIP